MKQFAFTILATLVGMGGAVTLSPVYGLAVYYLFAVLRPQTLWEWVELGGYRLDDFNWSFYVAVTTLVNNAIASDDVGSGRDSHVDTIETDTLDQIIRAALYGSIWAAKYAIPYMRKAGNGSIINISASSSVGSIPARPAYQASKGAINSLTRQMAFDYGKENIRTNTIVVGFINTGTDSFKRMLGTPEIRTQFEKLVLVPRLGEPSDIAYGAIYLASDESKYVTGSQLFIEGGALCHQSQPDLQLGRRNQTEKNAIMDASGG